MIRLEEVRVRYPQATTTALTTPVVTIGEGELVLVVGPTGSGKSTLLGTLNGLVPHFTGGTLSGRVVVDGRDTREYRPRDLADVIGVVRQNPAASFVADTVEDEIAYGMETLGVRPNVMRRRVEETLDLLGLATERHRLLRELSGGQQQRVAIAAVLAAGPHVLVLDEPTSALDPVAAEEVLSALQRLVHDLSLTVVLAEHRLERVIHHADRIILVHGGQATVALEPAEAMARSVVFPPVIELGRMAGWDPLPLSVRDARRRAGPLRAELAPVLLDSERDARARQHAAAGAGPMGGTGRWLRRLLGSQDPAGPGDAAPGPGGRPDQPAAQTTALTVQLGTCRALDGVDLAVQAGEVTAVMGRNGAGKSTLLWALVGQLRPAAGSVRIGAADPAELAPTRRAGLVGMVPQDPSALLYAQTVAQECADADAEADAPAGTAAGLLADLAGPLDPRRHPRDLSEGQRLALALAIVLSRRPQVVLLDEPTRGLDYAAKSRLVDALRSLTSGGHAVVMATHDVELAAEVADRVLLLADGQLVADDPSPSVLADSTAYAPQVARVLHPIPLLTVAAVRRSLEAVRDRSR
ncbi:MAG TPA: ATP-binding cassette domain-containing protein [Dermatophilaceae bacterium]|nr:ATP-binding cassette domain-containing protein [Dermatophilaceae bacterium]